MKKMDVPYGKKLSDKLEQIDALLFSTQYKQALAELRELENERGFVQPSAQSGHFYTIFSAVLCNLGHQQEALQKGLRAFDILKDSNEIQKIVRIQTILGDIYVRLGDLKNAEAEYRDAFAFYRNHEPCERLLDLHNKLARVCFIRGEFEQAIEYLKDGVQYAKQLNRMDSLVKLSVNLSTVYLFLGKFDLCEELHLLSVGHPALEKDKSGQVVWLLNASLISARKRRFTAAKESLREAYELAVKQGLAGEKAVYHEYAGEVAFETHDFLSAEKNYQEALKIGEETAPGGAIISQTCRLMAELRLAQGKCEEALKYCLRSLEVSQKITERFEEGMVYKILGQLHAYRGESELAKENFEKGISILKEIGAKYELGKAYLEAGKSSCYTYFERLKLLGQAEETLRETDSKYFLAKTYLALADLLYENEEYAKGISFAKDAEKLFEELKEEDDLNAAIRTRDKIENKTERENMLQRSSDSLFSSVVTENQEMLDIIRRVKQVSDTDLTILLEGETGTGKDILAKTIHYNGNRKNRRYIALNCASVPETLFESELFGYRKGAFTGASSDKKGLLEEADGGTLLLNEIGEMPLPIQAKLLGVIEEKEFTRLGDTKPRKVDVRFIAATNRDLKKAVQQRRFREDLYYRLSVIKVQLPPLRERKEDILPLVRLFLERHSNGNGGRVEELSHKITENLFLYDWPGNVR